MKLQSVGSYTIQVWIYCFGMKPGTKINVDHPRCLAHLSSLSAQPYSSTARRRQGIYQKSPQYFFLGPVGVRHLRLPALQVTRLHSRKHKTYSVCSKVVFYYLLSQLHESNSKEYAPSINHAHTRTPLILNFFMLARSGVLKVPFIMWIIFRHQNIHNFVYFVAAFWKV